MKMNSPQKTARVAAFVFVLIFFLGMSTELFIRPGLIVPGDIPQPLIILRHLNHSSVSRW